MIQIQIRYTIQLKYIARHYLPGSSDQTFPARIFYIQQLTISSFSLVSLSLIYTLSIYTHSHLYTQKFTHNFYVNTWLQNQFTSITQHYVILGIKNNKNMTIWVGSFSLILVLSFSLPFGLIGNMPIMGIIFSIPFGLVILLVGLAFYNAYLSLEINKPSIIQHFY